MFEKYKIKKISELSNKEIKNKNFIVRVDYNVPVSENGKIQDYQRVKISLETIKYLLERDGNIILISHFGDPDISADGNNHKTLYSFNKIIDQLSIYIEKQINGWLECKLVFVNDNVIDLGFKNRINEIFKNNNKLILLENIRFYPGEKNNDIDFAKYLAAIGDFYVNDAFSCSHRKHASIFALPQLMKPYVCAGFSLHEELTQLNKILYKNILNEDAQNIKKKIEEEKGNNQTTLIVGGKKISSKLPMLQSMINKVDNLIIIGAMANTFLYAMGVNIGNSIYEPDFKDVVKDMLKKVILPQDVVLTSDIASGKITRIIDVVEMDNKININENTPKYIVDIGPKTRKIIAKILDKSSIVIWNGSAGIAEKKAFANGTDFIVKYIAELTRKKKIISVVGGGDTLAAIKNAGLHLLKSKAKPGAKLKTKSGFENDFSYASSGGGAFLCWLTNPELPGVIALCL